MSAKRIGVRLRWSNGREETLRDGVDAETTVITRPGPDGFCHFRETDKIDENGYAIYVEETNDGE
jgi:hypothetical protein